MEVTEEGKVSELNCEPHQSITHSEDEESPEPRDKSKYQIDEKTPEGINRNYESSHEYDIQSVSVVEIEDYDIVEETEIDTLVCSFVVV